MRCTRRFLPTQPLQLLFLVVLLGYLILQLDASLSFIGSSSNKNVPAWLQKWPRTTRIGTASTTTTTLGAAPNKAAGSSKRKFGQPAFAAQQEQPHLQQQRKISQQPLSAAKPQPPVTSSGFQKQQRLERSYKGDSLIGELHEQRVKTAGRVGTKRYVNPCKVFVGNLPIHSNFTEADLKQWLCDQMGLPAHVLLNECKIVEDWKTGRSKGFGFAVFTEAIYATVCIDKCHLNELRGRRLTVKQGQKKQDTSVVYVEKKKRPVQDEDEQAIRAGMQQANGLPVVLVPHLDRMEVTLLRQLDPDLVDEYTDEELFETGNNDDDDDDEVDGIWMGDDSEVEDFEPENMNREKRRQAARKQKRKRAPSNGFGGTLAQ
jgi:RNA recognition motif-containing protein